MKIKNLFTFGVGVVVVIILVIYMISFQVRYDEVAVLTTFDRATPPQLSNGKVDPEHAGSLITKPGLYFKLPWPIQKVYSYPKRLILMDDDPEEQQTNDNYAVVVHFYVTWRIEEPHAFFVSLQSADAARTQLHSLLREVTSVIGRYKFNQLVNTDPGQLKLDQIEQDALDKLRDRVAHATPSYGITIEHVGIRRISLPEATTSKVFERMRATRERLAADARSTGEARAQAIRSQAASAQRTILSFAENRAQAIRAEGDRQAAGYYAAFKDDEDFAIFLRKAEALRKMLAHNTTFVLDANDLAPTGLFTDKESGAAAEIKK